MSTSLPNSIEEAAIVRRNNSSQHYTAVLHGDDEQLLPLSAQQFQSKNSMLGDDDVILEGSYALT